MFFSHTIQMNGLLLRVFSISWMLSFTSHSIHAPRRRIQSVLNFSQRNRTDCYNHGGGNSVFVNPPYSSIGEWVQKCYYEAQKPGTIVVLLIPARTDTRYFHDYILHRSEVRFLKGRLKFGDSKNSAPFPSMVVIFRSPGA